MIARPIEQRFWRMLWVRWQHDPLASGSHLTGGRWNRVGQRALYLSADHVTAVLEYNQAFVRPGTLAAFDVHARSIVDLTNPATCANLEFAQKDLLSEWRTAVDEGREPASWGLADRLVAEGVDGALVPSLQNNGGTNLVLWQWSSDGSEGARVRVVDPHGDLAPA